MGMPATTKRWTAQEVRDLTSESRPWPRYEVIDGKLLVTPAPRRAHQRAVTLLWRLLEDHARAQRIGRAEISPADIELEPDSIVQPDIFVVPAEQSGPACEWKDVTRLILAVEILSPSSARFDRVTKRAFYARTGVPE